MSAKLKRYDRIYTQAADLVEPIDNPISRMSTIASLLHHKMSNFFWTGFYLIDKGELLVGPYQGPIACLRLKKDVGVCWAGLNTSKTVIVDDVETFPGHIACSSLTKSEIVVPVIDKKGNTIGVLDVDSKELSNFDEDDKQGLEKLVSLIF
ncbi:GAF domain-containing protein [Saccharicrinis aurantiacus]|uniref:GAF domain-containing protein n=1 Tax=Saccharicrinis aurantiacus TaxID=1849719 RepID=UPI00095004FB|nr:GAF domain-containing protein [Saccharicrinis aurantiacus]